MRFPVGFGPSNVEQSYIADQQETINFYPAPLNEGRMAMYPTPGVKEIGSVAPGGGRGHAEHAEREWAVIAGTFYEIGRNGALTSKGSVAVGDNPATISYNGDGGGEIFITSGTNGYIYDLGADTLTQITALNGIADQGDHIDGYFLALDQSTSTVYFSDLLDGTTWQTGSNFFQRSSASDGWHGMKVLNGELIWLFGILTSEVWYNAGQFPIPFEPHPSGRGIEFGTEAPFSPAVVQGTMYWLGRTSNGRGMVLSTSGFSPERVSTPSIELAIQGYEKTAKATGDAYEELGHVFYVLRTPQGGTVCYDATSSAWHKRATWIAENNRYDPWRAVYHAYVFDEHRWLDAESGSVYQASVNIGTDVGGRPLRRLRRTPALLFENERLYHSGLELLMDVGIGTQIPGPVVELGTATGLDNSFFQTTAFSSTGPVTVISTAAYYEFEDDGTDSIKSHDMTAVNSPTYALAIKNKGAVLVPVTDATDSPHFTIAAGSAGDFNPGTNDFVVALWFRCPPQINALRRYAVAKETLPNNGWWVALETSGLMRFLIGDGSVSSTADTTSTVMDDKWHSLVVNVFQTEKRIDVWLDKVRETTTTISSSLGSVAPSSAFYVGRTYLTTDSSWHGSLDQVVFVGNKTWSAAQINGYHNQALETGSDPHVELRASNDGGKNWGSHIQRSAGKAGEYDKRVRWDRLGMARKRAYEFVVSDPVPWRLVDVYLEIAQPPRKLSQAQAVQWSG